MEPTYLDMLQAELRDYEAQYATAQREAPSVYRDWRLKAWRWSISVKRAQIERESIRCSSD